jgi:hypothetical protein
LVDSGSPAADPGTEGSPEPVDPVTPFVVSVPCDPGAVAAGLERRCEERVRQPAG